MYQHRSVRSRQPDLQRESGLSDVYKTDFFSRYSDPYETYRRGPNIQGHHYTYESNYYNFAGVKNDEKSGTYQFVLPGTHQADVESRVGASDSRRRLIANSSGNVYPISYIRKLKKLNASFSVFQAL